MQYIFVIPVLHFLSNYVAQGRSDKAFLNVYLPCLLVLPHYFIFRIPHLPSLSVSEAALIPISIGLIFKPEVKWAFRRMDLWVVLFVVSAGLSEVLRESDPKDGFFLWMADFLPNGARLHRGQAVD